MNHVSRLFSLFCLLGSAAAVQAQSTPAASGTATPVSQHASTASPYTKPAEEVTTTSETTALDSPAAVATTATEARQVVATVTVKGKVLDEENKPMAGVVVYIKDAPVKDASSIATTDANGEYSLEAPAGVNTLTFSYAGYQDQQLSASNFLPTAVQLLPASNKKKLDRISRR
ncbi:carboxypeptidase-like regulatory domain-containing protein [Hymenobacter lucidus]|uniref:Carboxypeptidase-like regulatory domain-containing protein n=1 Tax=Hymenobacter lucidus TaxID=2880930 RepID=A0ABS8ANI9_9BACT|nr:carboxypeptidase regulatory-like domain-containing protein [Hymenobacter lucidus]MCB2407750.1 carboxypeptidase-like regulatory domain-containing protein [Hymenobacter lucidus]